MKQGIPKSVQDLLARQTPGDEHPSADLLNGFMEQSLMPSETAQVTNHLAACKDCREIVFLASGVKEEELVPAVAAAMPAQERQVVETASRPRSRWAWWKWAAPAVAVIVVAAGVLVEQHRISERASPASNTLALSYPAPSTATTNQENAVELQSPAQPAAKASQGAPTESKKHAAAEARQSAGAEQARLQQQLALQRSMESARLSSSLEKPRPNAMPRALAAMPAAPPASLTASLVSGDFTGTVTDPSGAVVPNATVTLRNNGTGQMRTTISNNNGAYRFSLLQPGSYTVRATANGFSKAETTAMINAGQATVGDVKLAVGSSSQTVEVTSAVPLVQADKADLSTNFGQNVVANAPNAGNDLTYIQKTAPAGDSGQGGKDQTESAASLKSGLMSSGQPRGAVNQLAKAALPAAHWRISADGHLERALPGSAWTRVLVDQPVTFRVVAIVGSSVWAGGSGGALFHSSDRGESWNRVGLSANGHAERSAVVSIHFDNAMQGSLSTASGATWVTSDGGQNWTKP